MGAVRFRLFGFPIEIQLGFWVLALIIGLRPGRHYSQALFWLGIIFVSILVHELGHAFAARAFGQSPSIVLHMLGGVTSWSATRDIGKLRRILVTLAGPGAGFGLAVLAYVGYRVGLSRFGPDATLPSWLSALEVLAFANVFWSVINLLPVLPFDGGQVLATALGPERRKLSATVSLVFGIVTALVLFRLGSLLGALLFAMGGVSNFFAAMQEAPAPRVPEAAVRRLLVEAQAALEAGDLRRARELASAVLDASSDLAERKLAFETLVWSALGEGDVARARDLLRGARGGLDPYVEAAVAEADGDRAHAAALLGALRSSGDQRVAVAAALVRLRLGLGDFAGAVELVIEIADAVPDEDLARIADEADAAGRPELAAKVRELSRRRGEGDGDPEPAR